MALTATAGELEGSGVEDGPGGAADDGGNTLGVTSEDADASGAGGHNGAVKIERGRVAVRRGNPERNSSGVRERKGGPEASGVAETPGGLLRSGRGSRVAEGHQKPQSGRVAPGGGNLQIDPQGQHSARGIRTGSGRGEILQPPKTPKGATTPAAEPTSGQGMGRKRRNKHAQAS